MSRARAIAAWAADLTWQDVPAGVRDHATDDLRDVLSVMFAGTLTTSAQIAARSALCRAKTGVSR